MSRLTRYHHNGLLVENGGYYEPDTHYMAIVAKLGKIEDLMEKYEIEDLTELEIALDYYYTERVGK